jgi:hypothetical protein
MHEHGSCFRFKFYSRARGAKTIMVGHVISLGYYPRGKVKMRTTAGYRMIPPLNYPPHFFLSTKC